MNTTSTMATITTMNNFAVTITAATIIIKSK